MTILEDVLRSLKSYTNHVVRVHATFPTRTYAMAALALSTYTEVFGGLFRGTLEPGNSGANYNTFINCFFRKEYSELDYELQTKNKERSMKGLYKAVRCGLVHEHFVSDKLMVILNDPNPDSPPATGILFTPKQDGKIKFILRRYHLDLLAAVALYRNKLEERPGLVCNYLKALESVGARLPRSGNINDFFRNKEANTKN